MIQELRRRWQIKTGRYETPFDTEVPFWIVSLLFHLALILILTLVFVPGVNKRLGSLSSSAVVDDPMLLEELVPEDVEVFETEVDEIGEESDVMLEVAAAATPTLEILSNEVEAIEAPTFDTGNVFAADVANEFEAASPKLDLVAVRSKAGQSLKSTGGAIDRIAEMINDKMSEGDLTVVWIFDQSASLSAQRTQIAQQFDRVYRQLQRFRDLEGDDSKKKNDKPPLLTDIYQFGKSISPLLPKPSADLDELRGAVENVVRDDSGIENVMQAVMSVVNKYRPRGSISARRADRNVMVIVVTDEAGDDLQLTDDAVRVCVEASVSVSTIGIPAPFGRQETMVKWVDPDPEYDQEPQMAVVDQGAETPRPERLRLEFVKDDNDFEQIDSGFGPFFLTRLCYESGGLYFAVHPNRTGTRRVRWGDVANYASSLTYFFDPEVMRRYQPSYVSMQAYNAGLSTNRARMALVKAAESTRTGKPLRSPKTRFARHDEGEFARNVSRAQKDAAFVGPELDRLMQTLKMGEADREKEQDPRWQAGYDLAMGRAIAARLRASTYNQMLALIKTSLKFDPPKDDQTPQNNTWVLKPADTIETGSRDAQLAEKARTYLKRVMEQHPGTPWALLAEQELRIPIGWEWTQRHTEPKERRQGMGNGNQNPNGPMENRDPAKKRDIPRL